MKTSNFNLVGLIKTVFEPKAGENIGVFIDLENPKDIQGLKFLSNPKLHTQQIAYSVFYTGLLEKKNSLPFDSVHFYAYTPTGGSNLELPETVTDLNGNILNLVGEVLPNLHIVLYLSTFSATAPLTRLAKQMGFRGATMHGCNETILNTGLSQNYEEISRKAERLRQVLTRCDDAVVEFEMLGHKSRLTINLGGQEAQKSHGLCRVPGEIANLPAGEIYWVPKSAEGEFPIKFKEDNTLALLEVSEGRVVDGTLVKGNPEVLNSALKKFREDPATGQLGELGLGTQTLPPAGCDIQDEKILGTMHLATGRDDHLGGDVGLEKFKDKKNATHEDILFSPEKTPEIKVRRLWIHKDSEEMEVIKNYKASEVVKEAVEA